MKKPPPACPTCGYPVDPEECDRCNGKIVPVDGLTTIQPGRRFFAFELMEGFFSLFQASLLLMTKKEFMGRLGVALLVNFALVVLFGMGVFWGFHALVSHYLDDSGTAATLTAVALALVATWFLAPTVISVGLTPFLEPIADATERMLAGEKMKPVQLGVWRNLVAGLNAASQILLVQVCILVPVFLIAFFLPVISWPFVVVAVVISAYVNAISWFEIPVLRRGYGMRYRRQIVRRNWPRTLGFGLAFYVGMLVPFFNILFIGPASAVAVSTLYFRFDKSI
jgi:uncharacterized protein involved in cysteine biosynthesis